MRAMTNKQLMFSVTKNDLRLDTFRCGGNGGQNVNKVESGARWTHPASGAVAQSCTYRTQWENKKEAFRRLVETPAFKAWHKLETARWFGNPVRETEAQILARVDRMIEEGLRDGSIIIECEGAD